MPRPARKTTAVAKTKPAKKLKTSTPQTNNKPWLLLVNPASGGGRSMMALPEIRKALQQAAIPYVESLSASKQEFLYSVEHSKKYCGVAIAGGDSSLVMALPLAARKKISLAFFGSGSQNDIARHLKHYTPYNVVQAMTRPPQATDAFLVTTEIHPEKPGRSPTRRPTADKTLMIGGQVNFGLGVEVNRFVERLKKKHPLWYRLQFIAGFYSICRTVLKGLTPVPMQVKSQGLTLEGEFHIALFTKIKYWAGGFFFAPQAELDDGKIAAVFVRRCSLWRLLRILLAAIKGRHLGMPEVTLLQAKEFTITFATPQAAQVDGDIWERAGQEVRERRYHLLCKPQGYWLQR